jgi:hypothetical protein
LLKEAQARYAGRQFEELYEKWLNGAIADTEMARNSEQVGVSGKGVFGTMVCGSSLSVFTDPRGNNQENFTEKEIADGIAQISTNRSLEISRT